MSWKEGLNMRHEIHGTKHRLIHKCAIDKRGHSGQESGNQFDSLEPLVRHVVQNKQNSDLLSYKMIDDVFLKGYRLSNYSVAIFRTEPSLTLQVNTRKQVLNSTNPWHKWAFKYEGPHNVTWKLQQQMWWDRVISSLPGKWCIFEVLSLFKICRFTHCGIFI